MSQEDKNGSWEVIKLTLDTEKKLEAPFLVGYDTVSIGTQLATCMSRGLHLSSASQKTWILINTAGRTSHLALREFCSIFSSSCLLPCDVTGTQSPP